METTIDSLNVEAAVRDRYSKAAQEAEAALCCPVDYDAQYLAVIPQEVIDRDYGCGDPSKYVQPGEVVLDLGSGGGKICFIASQVVGPEGRVIGVDCNAEMLGLARKHCEAVGNAVGYHNVEFRHGTIQDLGLNLDLLDAYLAENPIENSGEWLRLESETNRLRESSPLIESDSIDVIVSNCVLNLVDNTDRLQLFREMYRVLNRGGRAVISDIVSDESIPAGLQADPRLWSGCISGAFRENEFLKAFEQAGFYGIEIVERQAEPWAIVEGIEFRSVTVQAFKGKDGPCLERNQAVIYNGPWKAVVDDDGHQLHRGERMAVCDKTFQIYTRPPYGAQITPIPPYEEIAIADAREMDCKADIVRPPQQTKAASEHQSPLAVLPQGGCCGPDGC